MSRQKTVDYVNHFSVDVVQINKGIHKYSCLKVFEIDSVSK